MTTTSRTVISIRTTERTAMLDVTSRVQQSLQSLQAREGLCLLFCPHTTAGLTVNEGADPEVARDISDTLTRLVPAHADYRHTEGNSDAHVKSALTGVSLCVGVEAGHLVLGKWQRIFFCEFDGPRQRELWVRFAGA